MKTNVPSALKLSEGLESSLESNNTNTLLRAYVSLVDLAQRLPPSQANRALKKAFDIEDTLKRTSGWSADCLKALPAMSSASALALSCVLIESDVLSPKEFKIVMRRLRLIAKEETLVGLSATSFLKRLKQSP